jgi:hypothetical protein
MPDFEGAVNTSDAPPASDATAGAPADSAAIESGVVTPPPAPDGTESNATGTTGEAPPAREGFIPRDRFDAVNQRLQEVAPWQDALGLLQERYGTPDAFLEDLRAAEEADATQRVNGELAEYVERGDISPEFAESVMGPLVRQLLQLQPMAQEFQQTRAQVQQAAQLDALRKDFPSLDDDAVLTAMQAGRDPRAVAQRSHERVQGAVRAALSQQATQLATAQAAPPLGETGAASQFPSGNFLADQPDPITNPAGWDAWARRNGIK